MKTLLFTAAATLVLAGCATTEDDSGASTSATTGATTGADAAAPASTTTDSATTSQSTTTGPATATAPASATTASDYLRMAGASDLYEIQSSQAVLQSTQNADLRRFAQMMIEDHTKTTQQLASAAQAAGMTASPPALDARKADMVRQLQAASGTARDKLYATQQVTAHQEALTLHNGYASGGDNQQLRAVATQTVPIIQQHLADIQRIAGGMG